MFHKPKYKQGDFVLIKEKFRKPFVGEIIKVVIVENEAYLPEPERSFSGNSFYTVCSILKKGYEDGNFAANYLESISTKIDNPELYKVLYDKN